MTRLGILLSGGGSNFRAIDRAIRDGHLPGAEIAVVLSNIPEAPGLAHARALGYPAIAVPPAGRKRAEHDQEFLAHLREARVDLVCLAGYLRLLSPAFVQAFPNRILNIHPSLLPAFPGLDAQHQAWEYGVRIAGCTVHLVDEQLDHGVILVQRSIPVDPTWTAEDLRNHILHEEHLAYPEALDRLLSGHFEIVGRRFVPRTHPRP